mgnify:CR=1 FL=1
MRYSQKIFMIPGVFFIGLVLTDPAAAQWVNRYSKVSDFNHHTYLEQHELPILAHGLTDPAPAPDGKTLAMAARGWIWQLDLATGKATQLTNGPAVDSRPRWSPDGKKLAIVRDNGTDTAIVVLNLENGQVVRAFHASSAGDRVGIYPDSTEKELENKVDHKADLFLVGHTHQPLIRPFRNMIISNVGSVGLPFDGDKRGAYAQFTYHGDRWSGEIIRVEYDLPAAVQDFLDTNFIPEGGPMAEIILAELKLGWPQLSSWFRRYEERVLAGEISLVNAVDLFLKNPHIEQARDDTAMSYP